MLWHTLFFCLITICLCELNDPLYQHMANDAEPLDYRASFGELTIEQASWLSYGNLAKAAHIDTSVETVIIPIHINVVLIGFRGRGHNKITLSRETLDEWLHHLDHVGWHSIVTDTTNKQQNHISSTTIQYKYSYTVVHAAESVIEAYEEARNKHTRLISKYSDVVHVDADGISEFFDSFSNDLGLSYTPSIFIVNPNKLDGIYGYRSGFSDDEIEYILNDHDLMELVHKQARNITEMRKDRKKIYKKKESPKLDFEELLVDKRSELWAELRLRDRHRAKKRASFDISAYLNENIYKTFMQDHILSLAQNHYLTENCLTENWITNERNLILDLRAGPFSWGPIGVSEGVKSGSVSIPSVDSFNDDDDIDNYADYDDDHNEVKYTKARLEAELILLIDRIRKECDDNNQSNNNMKKNNNNCNKLHLRKETIEELINPITSDNNSNNDDIIKQTLKGNTFFLKNSKEIDSKKTRQKNLQYLDFFGKLNAFMSKTVKHVITPINIRKISYAKQINFHIYILKDHESFVPFSKASLEHLQKNIKMLQLKEQEFSFVVQEIQLSEEPTLTMAWTSSLRWHVLPRNHYDGRQTIVKRMIIDTKVLESHLINLSINNKDRAELNNQARHVPIFIFSLDSQFPIFLEESSQSIATDHMILAIQSSQHLWESDITCNGSPVYKDLRDPMSSILSSVVDHLSGLPSTHMGYSQAHGNIVFDWLWSVGNSPSSVTSHGISSFNLLVQDNIARAYIIQAIVDSNENMNIVLNLLRQKKTTLYNINSFGSSFHALTQLRGDVDLAYVHLGEYLKNNKFKEACEYIDTLQSKTRIFVDSVNAAIERLDTSVDCGMFRDTIYVDESIPISCYLLSCILCLLMIMMKMLLPSQKKTKIN